uniref:ORF126 n=1 Tax=Malaco herpesvirus 1 TaxID=3031797 RepID=A0AA48SFI1_9VIRU|nr:TPA_asm: ORF126 [Malaco herpesvirus 1]
MESPFVFISQEDGVMTVTFADPSLRYTDLLKEYPFTQKGNNITLIAPRSRVDLMRGLVENFRTRGRHVARHTYKLEVKEKFDTLNMLGITYYHCCVMIDDRNITGVCRYNLDRLKEEERNTILSVATKLTGEDAHARYIEVVNTYNYSSGPADSPEAKKAEEERKRESEARRRRFKLLYPGMIEKLEKETEKESVRRQRIEKEDEARKKAEAARESSRMKAEYAKKGKTYITTVKPDWVEIDIMEEMLSHRRDLSELQLSKLMSAWKVATTPHNYIHAINYCIKKFADADSDTYPFLYSMTYPNGTVIQGVCFTEDILCGSDAEFDDDDDDEDEDESADESDDETDDDEDDKPSEAEAKSTDDEDGDFEAVLKMMKTINLNSVENVFK